MTTTERAKQLAREWQCRVPVDTMDVAVREITALLNLLVEARLIVMSYAWREDEAGLLQQHPLIERIDKALGGER